MNWSALSAESELRSEVHPIWANGVWKLGLADYMETFLSAPERLGGRSDLGLLCLLSAQLEWAAPDRDRGWKTRGVAFCMSNSHPDNQVKAALHHPFPWLMLQRGNQPWGRYSTPHPNWLLPLGFPCSRKWFCVCFFTSVEVAGLAGCGGEEGAQSVLRELSWIKRSKPGRHMGIQNRPSSNISCKLQQSATWRERGGCSKRSWLLCGTGWLRG